MTNSYQFSISSSVVRTIIIGHIILSYSCQNRVCFFHIRIFLEEIIPIYFYFTMKPTEEFNSKLYLSSSNLFAICYLHTQKYAPSKKSKGSYGQVTLENNIFCSLAQRFTISSVRGTTYLSVT